MNNGTTLTFALVFLASIATFAQTLQPYSSSTWGGQGALPSGFADVSEFSHIDVVRGSPYLYDEFIVGTVYYNGFSEVSHLPLRFNILTGEFEVVRNDSIYIFAEPEQINRILLEDEMFTYIAASEEQELSGFLKMWDFNFPTIATRMRNYLVEQTYHQHYLFDYTNPVYILPMRDEHYMMKSETEVVRIPGMKRGAELSRLADELSLQFAK